MDTFSVLTFRYLPPGKLGRPFEHRVSVEMAKSQEEKAQSQLAMQVVNHVRELIESGELRSGDQIPAEREFAKTLGISRASLRAGIGFLAAMGVLKVQHGVGTFVAAGPPALGASSLRLLSALHGLQPWQMFEARQVLESSLAALAAERGDRHHVSALAEEVTDMYASLNDPREYLIHDLRFHRIIADAAGNPILGAFMESITAALYDDRYEAVKKALDLKEAAEMHGEIFRAIRAKDGAQARIAMARHLELAENAQSSESAARGPAERNGGRQKVSSKSATQEKLRPNSLPGANHAKTARAPNSALPKSISPKRGKAR